MAGALKSDLVRCNRPDRRAIGATQLSYLTPERTQVALRPGAETVQADELTRQGQ